jgi:hypothetical protein
MKIKLIIIILLGLLVAYNTFGMSALSKSFYNTQY